MYSMTVYTLTPVMYRSPELMGGHADLTCLTAGECADAILSGNVKALGIDDRRALEGLPDVPTFKEQGYDGFIDGADRAIACANRCSR